MVAGEGDEMTGEKEAKKDDDAWLDFCSGDDDPFFLLLSRLLRIGSARFSIALPASRASTDASGPREQDRAARRRALLGQSDQEFPSGGGDAEERQRREAVSTFFFFFLFSLLLFASSLSFSSSPFP